MSEDWPPELRRLLAKKVIRRKTPTRLNLLSVKYRTFIQENRAAQNVILSQILTAFLNFTISIVKTPQASKKQQIFRNPSKMPRKKSTSEKCLPILSRKSRRSGGQSSDITVVLRLKCHHTKNEHSEGGKSYEFFFSCWFWWLYQLDFRKRRLFKKFT